MFIVYIKIVNMKPCRKKEVLTKEVAKTKISHYYNTTGKETHRDSYLWLRTFKYFFTNLLEQAS